MDVSQIAITTNEISQDPVTAIELACSWGIRHFELKQIMGQRVPRVPEDELGRAEAALAECGATAVAVSPGLFMRVGWGSEEAAYQRDELLPQSIVFAHRFDVTRLIVFAFRRPELADPESPCPSGVLDELGAAAELAQREGITLVLENLVRTWADTGAHTAEVLRRVDHPVLLANWDPANALISGEPLPYPQGYRPLADRVGHVHLSDVVRDTSERGWRSTALLDGEIDWRGQIAALREADYRGYITIETEEPPLVGNPLTDLNRLRHLLSME